MDITHDKILCLVDDFLSLMSLLAPEEIYHVITSLINLLECFLGKGLPPFFLMTIALPRAYC